MDISGLTSGELIFYICLMLLFLIMPIIYIRSKKPIKSSLLSLTSGLVSLFIIHFLGGYIGIYIPVNLFTIAMSIILGAPGIIIIAISASGII